MEIDRNFQNYACDYLYHLGNSEPAGEDPVKIYPNPNSGSFTLAAGEGNAIGIVRIYDWCGRKVFEMETIGQRTVSVTLDDPAPGMYFCAMLVDGVWFMRQVTVAY